MASLTNLGSMLRTAGQQARWQAVYAMFEKVEIAAEGKIGKLVPRPRAESGFSLNDPYGCRMNFWQPADEARRAAVEWLLERIDVTEKTPPVTAWRMPW